jgi:polyisoprenoid-binding protein YceI
MKRNVEFKMILLVCIAAYTMVTCERAPKGDDATIGEKEVAVERTGEDFIIDTARSYIRFTGHGVGKNHPGILKLSQGKVSVKNDSISGGSFIIDIRSMVMEQKAADIKAKLRPHLLSGDFFDVNKFPSSKFEITSIVPYESRDSLKSLVEGANFLVSGNLTLKDVTKNVSFPARVDLDGGTLKTKANFDIDRTQWQMNYGNDKTLGDKFISEKVNIELYAEARKIDGAI